MKKIHLILILSFLFISNSFAKEESIKSKQKIDLNLSLEEDRYSKYKEEKYSQPPTLKENKKIKEDDIEIGGEVEVDKVTKEVEKLKLDISKKF